MTLENLEKANDLKDKIDRESSILNKIHKLSNSNKNKELTSEDIAFLLQTAYDGVNYIKRDLELKFKLL